MLLMMIGELGGGLLSDIAGAIRSNRAEKAEKAAEQKTADSIDLNSLKELYGDKWKIVERDGKFTAVNKTDGTQHVDKTYAEMLEALKPAGTKEIKPTTDPNAISVEYAQARIKEAGLDGKITITDDGKIKYTKPTTWQEVTLTLTLNEANLTVAIGEILSARPANNDAEGDPPTRDPEDNFDITSKKTYETYTIKSKSDTWYHLAKDSYEIPAGVSIKDVYRALQRENFSGTEAEFNDAIASPQGIQWKMNDKIKLPTELNINGITVKLKADYSDGDITAGKGGIGTASKYFATSVTQQGTNWYITKNGKIDTTLGPFTTEDAAKEKLRELKGE